MRQLFLVVSVLVYATVTVCEEKRDGDQTVEAVAAKLDEALKRAKEKANEVENKDKEMKENGVDKVSKKSASDQLGLFAAPLEETKALARQASIQLSALKEFLSMENLDTYRLKANKQYLKVWKEKFRKFCPTIYTGPNCSAEAYYRTPDGTCNNLNNPTWGALLCPQNREIPPMYDDGIDAPRKRDRLGLPLPSARVVSNIVHQVKGDSPRNNKLTMMVMQWGQFIDHEFVNTPVLKGEMGANIECCGPENENRTQCFPIPIPPGDPYFNKTCMNFVRSAPVSNHDCGPGFREQINQVTSYFDGSAVYGSRLTETMNLRSMSGGKLKTFDDEISELLPQNTNDKCTLDVPEDHCQLAGDARVNVVPSLGWSHTTFMREHNRIATELGEINPHWEDETIFQQARRIISAAEQVINYNEYLPSILNEETMNKYQLNLKKTRYSRCYRDKINPTISNVFAVAAFRFGHSQIANYQAMMSLQYKFTEKKPIDETYHRPHMIIVEHGVALDAIARWLVADPAPLADGLFEDGVRNKLFMDKNGNSLDLPALNIQRARDHGIPSYNHWRIHCKLEKASMADGGGFVLPDHTAVQTRKLEQAYRHVDDIDVFAGAMTERLLPDSEVGPTFACLLGTQFRKLKKGDRYWHETPDKVIRFTKDQLKEVRKITLARVICDNFKIDSIQPNVFLAPGVGNERVQCKDLPAMDLTKWRACEKPLSDGRPDFRCARKMDKNG